MRTALLISLVGLAWAASGCSASGPAASGSGTREVGGSAGPASSAPSAVASSSGSRLGSEEPTMSPEPSATQSATPFVVRSNAFDDGGPIPRRHTCDGADVSPDIAWSGAPPGTRSLALVVRDPDARGFVHWIVFDIVAATEGALPSGMSAGAIASPEGTNDFGRTGYGGPCPPSGTHHYVFTLYALDRVSGLTGAPGLAAVEAAMRNHVIAQATLTGTYKRS